MLKIEELVQKADCWTISGSFVVRYPDNLVVLDLDGVAGYPAFRRDRSSSGADVYSHYRWRSRQACLLSCWTDASIRQGNGDTDW